MQTYLFYDLETTGLSKAFDQVLHFAAIRTDLKLQELERYEIKIKLNSDIIPSPQALLTHQISIHDMQTGETEITAMQKIHRWMNQPGTISLGYNTLGFDDEFLRFSFYRNLLSPYTHQYANQCNRMDLYPIAVLYFLYKNEIIQWPAANLKLEQLNLVNRFITGRSHHAMVDVEVTLALARCFAEEESLWNYAISYFNKQKDQTRLQELPRTLESRLGGHSEAILLEGIFGAEKSFQTPVLYLGSHKHYKNQTLWLQLDRPELRDTTPDSIAQTTWVSRKKWGEPGFILPPKERYLQSLHKERLANAAENKHWLQQHPDLFTEIIEYHCSYTYPLVPEADIATNLYSNGFLSSAEENLCRQFHQMLPSEKASLLPRFQNPILKTQALRTLGRHYPETLNPEYAAQFTDYMRLINPQANQTAFLDFKGKARLTPNQALHEIALLKNSTAALNSHDLGLLNELEAYLCKQFGVSYAA